MAPTNASPLQDPSGIVDLIPVAKLDVLTDQKATSRGRATSHPHGTQICASGCELSRHPTPPLTQKRFAQLAVAYQAEQPDLQSASLDELIYFGTQTREMLGRDGQADDLDAEHRRVLDRELAQRDFLVQLRVVDEFGSERVSLPATRVPLDVRQEFAMDVADFQPAATSGTIKRVGLGHIWQRL